MDLKIPYGQVGGFEEAFDAVRSTLTPEYLSRFKVAASVECDRDAGRIQAKGKNFTLKLVMDDTCAKAHLKLSFLLTPLKKSILQTLQKELEKVL